MRAAKLVVVMLALAGGLCAAPPSLAQSTPAAQSAAPATAEAARAARIKADLRGILSSPEFTYDQPHDTFWQRVGKWVQDTLEKIGKALRRIFQFRGPSGAPVRGAFAIGNVVLMVVLGVALLAIIGYGIARLAEHIAARRRAPKRKKKWLDITSEVVEPEESAAAEPDAWIRAANAHAAAGDYRKAYRAVFVAVLIRLDRLGALRFERSRTNGEYLRALRGNPALLGLLRPLARGFDLHWYGERPATEGDYRQAMSAYETVRGMPG